MAPARSKDLGSPIDRTVTVITLPAS
jgi:hypothetical protein